MAKPSKKKTDTPRLQDFNTSGVQSGTFPNAAGKKERVENYLKAVEKDLVKQKKERAKLSGKTGPGKISPKAKPMKTLPPTQA
jgi:hypothetical protein